MERNAMAFRLGECFLCQRITKDGTGYCPAVSESPLASIVMVAFVLLTAQSLRFPKMRVK